MAAASAVPSAPVSRSLARAEMTVPTEMMVEMPPAQDSGTPSAGYILGHAAPSSESGRPRLIKDR